MSKQPPPAPTASAIGPCPTIIQIVFSTFIIYSNSLMNVMGCMNITGCPIHNIKQEMLEAV